MIGTTRYMTDSTGTPAENAAYTAFGGEFRLSRDEREWAATGKAGREACVRPATCPDGVSGRRATGGRIDGTNHRYGYAGVPSAHRAGRGRLADRASGAILPLRLRPRGWREWTLRRY
jgi:hypothetical protein